MKISPELFLAYLKCPTKCWLRATHEQESGNAYAEWVKTQNERYRAAGTERLVAMSSSDDVAASPDEDSMKTDRWRLATELAAHAQMESWVVESALQAVERVPSTGRGKAAQFIPIRFIFTNKLGKDDKLLLAFDAFVLAKSQGREIKNGRIIHGDDNAVLKVKTSALAGEVRKRLEKIAALLSSPTPPDLVLNRHCAECEFQARCRKLAVEKDDLSLLANMSAKERQKFRSKGIFTVTQLSYTFRPRRRPKKLRDKREKYHHALKALAIREQKIHVVGNPELKLEGTPVYLDVEGLPDRDFYYLIGLRIGHGDSAVQHSLWADTVEDEGTIWLQFLDIVKTVAKPLLIYFGSFETAFFERMGKRYGASIHAELEGKGSQAPVNLLTIIFGQIYFPTYSNSLKDVAPWMGFEWSDTSLAGVNSLARRSEWERTRNPSTKSSLLTYNANDCQAAEAITKVILQLHELEPGKGAREKPFDTVYVESHAKRTRKFGPFVSEFKELEEITLAAWWNYQRDRIYVKSAKAVKLNAKRSGSKRIAWWDRLSAKKVIICPDQSICPFCGEKGEVVGRRNRTLYDLRFGKMSVKREAVYPSRRRRQDSF